MKISGTNIFWNRNPALQGKQLLLGSAAAVKAEKAASHQDFYRNVAALSKGRDRADTQTEKTEAITKDQPSYPMFEISEGEIPGKIWDAMEQYYQHAGQLADNITYTEERLKYLQSKYEQYKNEGDTSRAEKLEEEMAKIYDDMSWLTGCHLGISNAQVQMSQRLYGKEFSEEMNSQLGEMASLSAGIEDSLKGADSLEEAFKQLADAKEQVKSMADSLDAKYHEYTGKDLTPYEYKTAESYEGMFSDEYIIYDTEFTTDSSLKLYLKGYNPEEEQIKEAVNLLDERA